jgi:hypothetical protein
MKSITLVFLSAVLLSAAPAGPNSDKQDVLAAMDVYKNAMIHKDRAALEKILSSDLTYVHSGGQVETKADVIKSTMDPKSVIEKIELFPDTTVRIHGNTAFVHGKEDLTHSATNIVHMNVLHVWVKGPQGWQMVARQATLLKEK